MMDLTISLLFLTSLGISMLVWFDFLTRRIARRKRHERIWHPSKGEKW
jgi:hypothetical protein